MRRINHYRSGLLLVVLVVIMLLGICQAQAASTVASGKCGGNLNWTLDSAGVLTISGSGKMTEYDYHWTHSEKKPTPWENYSDKIQSLVIGSQVGSISNYAFSGLNILRFMQLRL